MVSSKSGISAKLQPIVHKRLPQTTGRAHTVRVSRHRDLSITPDPSGRSTGRYSTLHRRLLVSALLRSRATQSVSDRPPLPQCPEPHPRHDNWPLRTMALDSRCILVPSRQNCRPPNIANIHPSQPFPSSDPVGDPKYDHRRLPHRCCLSACISQFHGW